MSGFRFSPGYRVEIAALLVRNLIFPCLLLAFVAWGALPADMDWMRQILVIQAAMPAGIFAVVIVGNYSGNRDMAMRSIMITMLAGTVTLPLRVIFGLSLLPLRSTNAD